MSIGELIKRKKFIPGVATIIAGLFISGAAIAGGVPKITGSPKIVSPDLLEWPADFKQATPYLTEPTANRLTDCMGK